VSKSVHRAGFNPAHLELAHPAGTPLPAALRETMQTAFGVDFSAVRLHEGPQPARIGAVALATGTDIYFAPGRFRPDTRDGRFLLAHELAHVVQQAEGRVAAPRGAGLHLIADEALEDEADRMAIAAMERTAPRRNRLRRIAPQRSRVVQPFWVRRCDGTNIWVPNSEWNANAYEYVTWTWPLFALPRGVYRKKSFIAGTEFDDEYFRYRKDMNAQIGGGLDLDNDKVWDRNDPDACIETLFEKFRKQNWFVYSMDVTMFLNADDPPCHGDCKTLVYTFAAIAKHEFGVDLQLGCHLAKFLANGEQTIDPKAIGNCDNADYWFFQNHFWVIYRTTNGETRTYDLLFGTEGVPYIVPGWTLAREDGDDAILKNGVRVVHGPDYGKGSDLPAGRRRNTYKTELDD
jgi:Domain of unknown function (DUF4157)